MHLYYWAWSFLMIICVNLLPNFERACKELVILLLLSEREQMLDRSLTVVLQSIVFFFLDALTITCWHLNLWGWKSLPSQLTVLFVKAVLFLSLIKVNWTILYFQFIPAHSIDFISLVSQSVVSIKGGFLLGVKTDYFLDFRKAKVNITFCPWHSI